MIDLEDISDKNIKRLWNQFQEFPNLISATAYISTKLIARLIRKRTNKKFDKRDNSSNFSLTVGRPNYLEREFIKSCKKANEPFPIKKIQLKFLQTKKKSNTNTDEIMDIANEG